MLLWLKENFSTDRWAGNLPLLSLRWRLIFFCTLTALISWATHKVPPWLTLLYHPWVLVTKPWKKALCKIKNVWRNHEFDTTGHPYEINPKYFNVKNTVRWMSIIKENSQIKCWLRRVFETSNTDQRKLCFNCDCGGEPNSKLYENRHPNVRRN